MMPAGPSSLGSPPSSTPNPIDSAPQPEVTQTLNNVLRSRMALAKLGPLCKGLAFDDKSPSAPCPFLLPNLQKIRLPNDIVPITTPEHRSPGGAIPSAPPLEDELPDGFSELPAPPSALAAKVSPPLSENSPPIATPSYTPLAQFDSFLPVPGFFDLPAPPPSIPLSAKDVLPLDKHHCLIRIRDEIIRNGREEKPLNIGDLISIQELLHKMLDNCEINVQNETFGPNGRFKFEDIPSLNRLIQAIRRARHSMEVDYWGNSLRDDDFLRRDKLSECHLMIQLILGAPGAPEVITEPKEKSWIQRRPLAFLIICLLCAASFIFPALGLLPGWLLIIAVAVEVSTGLFLLGTLGKAAEVWFRNRKMQLFLEFGPEDGPLAKLAKIAAETCQQNESANRYQGKIYTHSGAVKFDHGSVSKLAETAATILLEHGDQATFTHCDQTYHVRDIFPSGRLGEPLEITNPAALRRHAFFQNLIAHLPVFREPTERQEYSGIPLPLSS